MEIQKLKEKPIITDDDIVKLLICGHVKEMMYMEKFNRQQTVKKLNKDQILILSTGEILDINHNKTRADETSSLAKTFYKIRSVINSNVIKNENIRWATLTYAENMKDTTRLYKDFDKFNKRFKTYLTNEDMEIPEYINIVEPQGRGAWHCHILYFFQSKAPFIPAKIFAEIWGHGFVKMKKVKNIDNIGAYLTAYLGDIPMDQAKDLAIKINDYEIKEVEYIDDNLDKQSKKILKGARLPLYPPGMNIIRSSRGIKRPIEEYHKYKYAKEKISSDKLTFSKTIKLIDNDFQSIIHHEFYNSNRT